MNEILMYLLQAFTTQIDIVMRKIDIAPGIYQAFINKLITDRKSVV